MKVLATGSTVFGTLALTCASLVDAHHSESMFVPTPVWVKGTVVEFARVNPHSIVTLEEIAADGQIRRWAVEGPTVSQLIGKGIGPDFLVAGDKVQFCAFPRRQPSASRPAEAPPFVHGLVLLLPNGEMLIWGTYGKLTNCVRPNEQSQVWVDFLRSSDPAYAEWCWKSVEIPTQEESRALVDEINSMIGNPCD